MMGRVCFARRLWRERVIFRIVRALVHTGKGIEGSRGGMSEMNDL